MSKFFNETTKARNVLLAVDHLNVIEVQDSPVATPPVEEPVFDPRISWLAGCRKLQIPPSSSLQHQFNGSVWLESAVESFRALRTRLLRLRGARELRSILVTSATQGEGKTLTSLNLAICCAQLPDLRVLLVDSDLRTAGLTRAIGSPSAPGLSEVLSGQCSAEKAILETDHANLYVLPATPTDRPPAELLASGHWQETISKLHETFNLILVDAPPVLSLADVELLTPACDGILMVVRAGHVRRDILEKSYKHFDPKKLLGLVYNGAESALYHRYKYGSSKN